MLSVQDGKILFSSDRCNRCGACLSSCQAGALSLQESDPVFQIRVDPAACVLCRKCVKVCPANDLPERPLLEEDFANLKHICIASARNEKMRFEASSGGVARALAQAALEKGLADAVYGVKTAPEPPFYQGAYFFQAGEIAQMANSVYYAFPFGAGLQKQPNGKTLTRLLVIGTSCQLQAAENFYNGSAVELIQVAIICKQQKTLDYVRWLRGKLQQPASLQAPIFFRGQGWPGQVRSNGRVFAHYFIPFGMETWRVSGCQFCPNPFGWKSDFVLADPWNLPISDSPGYTVTLLRTEKAQAFWEQARDYLNEWTALPTEPASPSHCAGTPLTAEDVKTCIDWWRYRRTKVDSIGFYMGREPSWLKRIGYTFLEGERKINGWLLLRFPHPKVQRTLQWFWGKSSKVVLSLVSCRQQSRSRR